MKRLLPFLSLCIIFTSFAEIPTELTNGRWVFYAYTIKNDIGAYDSFLEKKGITLEELERLIEFDLNGVELKFLTNGILENSRRGYSNVEQEKYSIINGQYRDKIVFGEYSKFGAREFFISIEDNRLHLTYLSHRGQTMQQFSFVDVSLGFYNNSLFFENQMATAEAEMIRWMREENFRSNVHLDTLKSYQILTDGTRVKYGEFEESEWSKNVYHYTVEYQGETVLSFDISCDTNFNLVNSLSKVNSVWKRKLIAYSKMIDGEFTIDYFKALELVKNEGKGGKFISLELNHDDGDNDDASSYIWEAIYVYEDESTAKVTLHPLTGKTKYYKHKKPIVLYLEVEE